MYSKRFGGLFLSLAESSSFLKAYGDYHGRREIDAFK